MDQAVMRKLDQMMNRTSPTAVPAKARSRAESRAKEILVEAGVSPFLLGRAQGQDGEGDPDEGLAEHLLPGPQAQGALLGDLLEVVEEADESQAHDEQQEQDAGGLGPRIVTRLATA